MEIALTTSHTSALEKILAKKDLDPVYLAALGVVLLSGRGATSLVQRALTIPYVEAMELVSRLEADGILATPDAQGKRAVLVGIASFPQVPDKRMLATAPLPEIFAACAHCDEAKHEEMVHRLEELRWDGTEWSCKDCWEDGDQASWDTAAQATSAVSVSPVVAPHRKVAT